MHVQMADEAYGLGGVKVSESYLKQEAIIEIAKRCRADAIHPGYGLLSENKEFARGVEESGLIFIGPPSEAIGRLGTRRRLAHSPARSGSRRLRARLDRWKATPRRFGRQRRWGSLCCSRRRQGWRQRDAHMLGAEEFASLLRSARSEAKSSFGDDRVYIEKYVSKPRHVEMQIIADSHGNAVYLASVTAPSSADTRR